MISNLWKKSKKHSNKLLVLGSTITLSFGAYKLYNHVKSTYFKDNELIYKIKKAEYFKEMIANNDNIKANFYSIIEKEIDLYLDHDNAAVKLGISGDLIENEQLQESLDGATKFALFKQMKILSFTKFILLQYYWSAITVLVNVQMSILSGFLFNNQISQDYDDCWFKTAIRYYHKEAPCLSDQYQRDFVNFSIKYLTESLPEITDIFIKSITVGLEKISLKKFCTNDELKSILNRLHIDLESAFTVHIKQNIYGYIPRLIPYDTNSPGDVFTHIFSVDNSTIQFSKLLEHIKMETHRRLINELFPKHGESNHKVPFAKVIPFVWNIDKCRCSIDNGCISLFTKKPDFRNLLFNIFELSIHSSKLKSAV